MSDYQMNLVGTGNLKRDSYNLSETIFYMDPVV